ncbi:triose-phosphate isomerase [Syntrophorhabdus aromaticivorans]|uniref:triose-phosphate isomerase n=1 Tax=Syntrophorhabdus aromaticivorans TaxID=328301 RepID=UPI0003FAEFE0|nr:cache domain-containing protein [Syntrophorhabdus aromaticivorans]
MKKKTGFIFKNITKGVKYPLIDVEEPELYRDVFPYTEVCKVKFDHKIELIDPPDEIYVTDTTFRDGQQSRPPFTAKQIEDLYEYLHRLGGPNGVIRNSEFFLYTDKDREAIERCLERGYRYPEITGWIRANKDDLQLVKDLGLRETGILTSASDYHIFLKLKKTRSQVFKEYIKIVESALEHNVIPRCHFEDVTRADIYGFCVPFAQALMNISDDAKIPIKIRLCDTLGIGITYPGAALPRSIGKLIRAMIDDAGVPSEYLEWHGHNDFHKVVINSVSAWLYGCGHVNGTLLGIGERTGNAPIEGLIMEYISLTGTENGIDTTVITEVRNYFEKEIGYQVPRSQPFIGVDFNATSAGVHIDGILKNEEIYTAFDTKRLLNRPIAINITDKSGLAGIAHWINSHFALVGKDRIEKTHPAIGKINKWIIRQYDEGRVTAVSDNEMEHLVRRFIPEIFVSEFELLKKRAYDMAANLIEQYIEDKALKSMVPEQQEEALKHIVGEYPFVQFAYTVNSEGIKITKNITQAVDRAKYYKIGLHEDFSDRDWFINPMKTGEISVTDIYSSKITGALCVTVSGPIRDEFGEIVGVLGLDIRFEDLTKSEE